MDFATKLKISRRAAGLKQYELADLAGVTKRTLSSYENGASLPKSYSIYRNLADVLGVTDVYLMGDGESGAPVKGEKDIFFDVIRERYGEEGVSEANGILNEGTALFAGGTLGDDGRAILERSLLNVFLLSKESGEK